VDEIDNQHIVRRAGKNDEVASGTGKAQMAVNIHAKNLMAILSVEFTGCKLAARFQQIAYVFVRLPCSEFVS
jgi:hypothetical protein